VNSQWFGPQRCVQGWEVAGRNDPIKGAAFHIDHPLGQPAVLNDPTAHRGGIDTRSASVASPLVTKRPSLFGIEAAWKPKRARGVTQICLDGTSPSTIVHAMVLDDAQSSGRRRDTARQHGGGEKPCQ
jgi:hypothetical protein